MKRVIRKKRGGNLQITRLGYIKGGVCDRIHQERRKREKGAMEMVSLLFQQQKRCLEKVGEEYRVINYPKYDGIALGRLWGGDFEIGLYRFSQDVIPQLIETKMLVTRAFLEKCAKQIASFEFGVSAENPLSILEGNAKFGYAPPHADAIYKKRFRKKEGLGGKEGE